MSDKSVRSLRRDSNLYLWDTRSSCIRLHNESRHAARQFKQSACVCLCVVTVIIVGDIFFYALFLYPAFKPDLDSGPTVV